MKIKVVGSLMTSDKMQPLFSLGDSFGEHLGRRKCNPLTCAEFLLGYAGLGNTIGQYKELAEAFTEHVNMPSSAPEELQPAYEHLQSVGYRPFTYKNATFAPSHSWSHQDVLDYFLLFVDAKDFDVESFKTRVSGEEFIRGEVMPMVSSDTWEKFTTELIENSFDKVAMYRIVIKASKLSSRVTKYAIHFGNARTNENMYVEFKLSNDIVSSAFAGEYCSAGFSERDFTAVVRGLVQKKFYPPPGTGMKIEDKIHFFAPYSCLLQSSCSGKTRFLLDPIKQDEHARCMIIYFSCQLNEIIDVSDESFKFLKNYVFNIKDIVGIPRRLLAMYCHIVRSITGADNQLKKEYRELGSLKFEKAFDFQRCIDAINNYDDSMLEADRKIIESLHCSSKPVYVVLALDEAHNMLKENILDSKDFFKYHSTCSNNIGLSPVSFQ